MNFYVKNVIIQQYNEKIDEKEFTRPRFLI